MKLRRLRIATCALLFALGLAACGHKQAHPSVADANNNGGYVDAGPITYQLQISRELNPYSTEDSQYVKGLPPGTVGPTPDQLWYGVFLWAKNQTGKPQTTSDSFVISDTQGNHYYPIRVDPNINEFAWTAQTLKRAEHRARTRHRRRRWPYPGWPDLVQAQHRRLLQPPVDVLHPGPQRPAPGLDLTQPLSRGRAPAGPMRVVSLALGLTAIALAFAALTTAAPAAAAGWGRPFELAKPGTLDDLAPQVAFSASGASAAAFGIEDVDVPGSSQGYLTSRSAGGRIGAARLIPGARQILALSFDGRALELLTGASPGTQSCCSSAQAVQLGSQGRLGRARTIVGGLTGDSEGQLLTLADGHMLAAVATERGVWAVQSSRGNRFTAQHRLTGSSDEPEAMSAAWLGGENTIVAWTAGHGTAGATDPRTIYYSNGTRKGGPRQAHIALTIPSGHRIDELGVARRDAGATLAWVESWLDHGGDYHSEVRAADLVRHPAIRTFAPADRSASEISFAADAAGDQGLAWKSCTAGGSCGVATTVRGAHGHFAAASGRLGAIDASEAPALTVGGRGQVLVGWVRGGKPLASVGSAGRGRFGAPRALSSSTFASDLTIAFGPRSQALAAWTQGTLNPSIVGAFGRF